MGYSLRLGLGLSLIPLAGALAFAAAQVTSRLECSDTAVVPALLLASAAAAVFCLVYLTRVRFRVILAMVAALAYGAGVYVWCAYVAIIKCTA